MKNIKENDLRFIQDQIGYFFKNTDLLEQAFTRRSYSMENGENDNEVLEFIGDRVLDIIVTKLLVERYGNIDENGEFVSEYQEGKLTQIKSSLVQKRTLAYRIDMLDLIPYIVIGNSDIKRKVYYEDSVKEDLFEAIIGAIALDSEWNIDVLHDAVEIMLDFDELVEENDSENYVQKIQEWTMKRFYRMPLYHFQEYSFFEEINGFPYNVKGIRMDRWSGFNKNHYISPSYNEMNNYKYLCVMKISDDFENFIGFGKSKSDARKNACKFAYDWLDYNDELLSIKDEIDNPNKNESISQLEILARRGYFSIPEYEFEQTYDNNGNSVWNCKCFIDEVEYYFESSSSSKKDAKKSAAFEMLNYVLEEM